MWPLTTTTATTTTKKKTGADSPKKNLGIYTSQQHNILFSNNHLQILQSFHYLHLATQTPQQCSLK